MQKKVIEHFVGAAELYASRKGVVHPEHDSVILEFIRNTYSLGSRFLEVGGGSGYFLDLIADNTSAKALYNCELVFQAYGKQINENICLIGGDAQSLPFRDNTFDYVIIKNLLHHLVGRSRKESKKNQRQAINELCRVAKNGGYLIILEQYNRYRVFSSIIFYATLFLSRFGVSFKPMGLFSNVIVSFLTPDEVRDLLINSNKAKVEIVLSMISRLNMPMRYRYTLLMSNIGRMLLIGKIHH